MRWSIQLDWSIQSMPRSCPSEPVVIDQPWCSGQILLLSPRRLAARAAAERIAAVIGCTAFDAGEDRAPFVCEFDIGVAEVQPGEGAVKALERAAAAAMKRDVG